MNKAKSAALLAQYGPYLAWLVALIATLGSLYYSEIAGFVPCKLCWYQRILMYPLTVIILVSLLRQNQYLGSYVLPFSITGLLVAFYHVLLEWGIVPEGTACAGGVPCGLRYVNYFGFITIPFLSLIAFILITVIVIGVWWAWRQE